MFRQTVSGRKTIRPMKMGCCVILISAFLVLSVFGISKGQILGCPTWPDQTEGARLIGEALVRISRRPPGVSDATAASCQVRISDMADRTVFVQDGEAMAMDPISGTDVNGDGLPEIVIRERGTTKYAYYFITIGENPPLVRALENGYGISFERSADGKVVLVVPDDGFQGLPDLVDIYHYESVVPNIRFVLEKNALRDVSVEAQAYYDSKIKDARSALTPDDIVAFQRGTIQDRFHWGIVKGKILTIVLSYLYSGRSAQAWEALEKTWPPRDQARIRQVILAARAEGSRRLMAEALGVWGNNKQRSLPLGED